MPAAPRRSIVCSNGVLGLGVLGLIAYRVSGLRVFFLGFREGFKLLLRKSCVPGGAISFCICWHGVLGLGVLGLSLYRVSG